MKITKKQLQKIIKEERARLLSEMNNVKNAERSLSLYAKETTVDSLAVALQNLAQEVEMGAIEDGLEEDEAEDYASDAVLLACAQALQAVGMIAEYNALYTILARG